MDKQTWQFVDTFAMALGALNDSAIIISLYLAAKNRLVDLKVSVAPGQPLEKWQATLGFLVAFFAGPP